MVGVFLVAFEFSAVKCAAGILDYFRVRSVAGFANERMYARKNDLS